MLALRRFQQTEDAPARLVCFPHAGGSAPFFAPLAKALAPDLDVLAAQYPGRQDRRFEAPVESIEALAESLLPEIPTDRPFAFFGHSMGATVAFEVARRLAPVELIVSARRGPATYRGSLLHVQSDEALLREMKSLGGSGSLDDEILRMALPALRADYKAVETYAYRPGPPLACPITTLIGDRDPKVTQDEALGWADHTSARFELVVFTGGHFYLSDHAVAVNALLADRLSVH